MSHPEPALPDLDEGEASEGLQWQAELSRRGFRRNLRSVLLNTTGGAQPMRLAELQHLAPQINELLGRFGASNVAVFGSVARDQANPGSDVDLLVDLPDGASLFDRAELKSALEELLLSRVDLIRRRNLKPSVKAVVEAEAVSL